MFCGANIAIFHKNGRFLTFRNKIIIFVVQSYLWLADIFLMKVYSLLSLNENVEIFRTQGRATLSSLVLVYWHFRCPIPTNTGVGYCLFVFGFFHNLRSDRRISSTLSLFLLTAFLE